MTIGIRTGLAVKIMEPLGYMYLQMKLEGTGLDQNGLLTRLSPGGEDLPLVVLARTPYGQTVSLFGDALPIELQRELAIRTSDLEFPETEVLLEPIRAYGIQPKVGHYKTYVFPKRYARQDSKGAKRFPKDDLRIEAFGFGGFADTVYAIEDNGVILSACVSARQNSECAEAWVFTGSVYRRKGLAKMVVAAWANAMVQEGIIPFYSHKMENLSSAILASRLELIPVFEEIVIESEG